MHNTCKESQTPFSHQNINVQHHFISKKLKNQKICSKHYPMENMIEGVLIKLLANDRHLALIKTMSLKIFDYSQNESVEGRTLDFLWSIEI